MFMLGALLLLALSFVIFRLVLNYPKRISKAKAEEKTEKDIVSLYDVFGDYQDRNRPSSGD